MAKTAMKITGFTIGNAQIGSVKGWATTFNNGTATNTDISVNVSSDNFSGYFSLNRVQSKKLIRLLEKELTIKKTR